MMVPVAFFFSTDNRLALPVFSFGAKPTNQEIGKLKNTSRNNQKEFWRTRDPVRGFYEFLCCTKRACLPRFPRDVLRILFNLVTVPVFVSNPKTKKPAYVELAVQKRFLLPPLKCVHLSARNLRYERTRVRAVFWLENERLGHLLSTFEDRVFNAAPALYLVQKAIVKCDKGRGYTLFYSYTATEDGHTLPDWYNAESKQFVAVDTISGFDRFKLTKGNYVECPVYLFVNGVSNVKAIRIEEGDTVPAKTKLNFALELSE